MNALVAVVFAVTGASLLRADAAATDTGARWVMGYYVGYLAERLPLNAVDWTSITHLAVGPAVPRYDGTVSTDFQLGDAGDAWARAAVRESHRQGRRAMLMLGGADTAPAFAGAASPTHRGNFVSAVIRLVDDMGFDGVDIDWEPLESEHVRDLVALARDLRRERPQLQLSAAVSPVNVNAPGRTAFDAIGDVAGVFDMVNVMTYGMNGGWSGWPSWHSSPLLGESGSAPMSVDSSINAYLGAGVPAHKLGVGIGYFGSCMTGATRPLEAGAGLHVKGDDNTLGYAAIMRSYFRDDLAHWDDRAQVPYLAGSTPFGPLGCTYLSYENPESIAAKARYARRRGLGGAIVWNLNLGHDRDSASGDADPLSDAVREGFLRP